jgi:predicted N-acyltransferase
LKPSPEARAGAAPDPVALEVHDSIASIDAASWNALAGDATLLRHEFLRAFEDSGCASAATGWLPQHLALRRSGRLVAALPLYRKAHSYGEYVFDRGWAEAYRRHGLDYYPKLLSAIPFTPVGGARLLAAGDADRRLLAGAALALAQRLGVSSLHVLFPGAEDRGALEAAGCLWRRGVQFHWRNADAGGARHPDFESFLRSMNHDKRKKIHQERRRLRDAGISFEARRGRDIAEADWAYFHRCYADTYRRHHSTPYLNLDFFLRAGAALGERFVLFVGWRAGRPIAASLCIRDRDRLYGRYWGASEWHSGLHFEACYYTPIEYAIGEGIGFFEGGAQGEHKLARGLLPVETGSAHWLADARFARAVEDHLERERAGIGLYIDELNEHSPFRAPEHAAGGTRAALRYPPSSATRGR